MFVCLFSFGSSCTSIKILFWMSLSPNLIRIKNKIVGNKLSHIQRLYHCQQKIGILQMVLYTVILALVSLCHAFISSYQDISLYFLTDILMLLSYFCKDRVKYLWWMQNLSMVITSWKTWRMFSFVASHYHSVSLNF